MTKETKQTVANKFDIQTELDFWNTLEEAEDSESQVVERFKKVRHEEISSEDARTIIGHIYRLIPEKSKPRFFLRLLPEIPKKDCNISREINTRIKNYCKGVFQTHNMDTQCVDSIGKEVCVSSAPEQTISDFIDNVQHALSKSDYDSVDKIAFSYIWLVMSCKEYRSYEPWKLILSIEKVFVKRFRTEKASDIKDCVLKSIPKAIANKTYEKQFLNVSYLYLDYETQINELHEQKLALENTVQLLLENKTENLDTISTLNGHVKELESQLSAAKEQCEKLSKELVLSENMLQFEKNRYEQQFVSKEKNLMSEVESIIGLEIEGIESVAAHLPEKEQARIMRYVRRIRDRITALGG